MNLITDGAQTAAPGFLQPGAADKTSFLPLVLQAIPPIFPAIEPFYRISLLLVAAACFLLLRVVDKAACLLWPLD